MSSSIAIKKLVILGAGGDAAVTAESVRAAPGQWVLEGFLDDRLPAGTEVHGARVLGPVDSWSDLAPQVQFLSALHKIKQMESRSARIEALGIPTERWATVADPTARVAGGTRIGHGVFLGPNVVVQPGSSIGDHVSIRAGANIGHDCSVASFCYIGPNATLCGNASMERGSHLGPNSCVADGQCVGAFAVVGMSSAVTKRLPEHGVYFGVPAVKIGTTKP